MAALLGLTAALCYGIGDYLARVAGRQVGVWPVLFFTELVSLVLLSLWMSAAASPAVLFFNAPADIRVAALLSALLLFVAVTLLTVGLVRGNLAVVAPVTATYGAVTTALAVLGGEPLNVTVANGLLLTIGGVCLLSVPANAGSPVKTHLQASGFGWAIGAALCYGIGLWMQGQFAVPAMGPLLPVWLCFAVGTGVLLLCRVVQAQPRAAAR
jgi:drug/metabolite transporter (DMT)-like permease